MAREPLATPRAAAARRRPAATPTPRPSRLRLWLRRRRGTLRAMGVWGAGLVALAAAGVAVVAFAPAARLPTWWDDTAELAARAGFTVETVLLEGAHHTPPELVREALGVARGDPMLGFSPTAARERVEAIAWVARAHVERHLPHTIRVRIEERAPFAIWQLDRRFFVIDRAGRVVATDQVGAFGRLPLVVGAGADRHAAAMVDRLIQVPEVMDRTHALVRVADRRWNLHLRSGADVLLPEAHEDAALARLVELQASQQLLDRPLVAIDLRLPDRLVLRPPPPPPADPTQPRRPGAVRG